MSDDRRKTPLSSSQTPSVNSSVWRDVSLSVGHPSVTRADIDDESVDDGRRSHAHRDDHTSFRSSDPDSEHVRGKAEVDDDDDDEDDPTFDRRTSLDSGASGGQRRAADPDAEEQFDEVTLESGTSEDDDEAAEQRERSTTEQNETESGASSSPPPPPPTDWLIDTCFNDGVRKIDFVLAYCPSETPDYDSCRNAFETSLRDQGFELEHDHGTYDFGKTWFLKIHAPFQLLARQAELQRLQKAFMVSDLTPDPHQDEHARPDGRGGVGGLRRRMGAISARILNPFRLQERFRTDDNEYFTEPFERAKLHTYIGHEWPESFFTPAQRIYLTWDAVSSTSVELNKGAKRRVWNALVEKLEKLRVSDSNSDRSHRPAAATAAAVVVSMSPEGAESDDDDGNESDDERDSTTDRTDDRTDDRRTTDQDQSAADHVDADPPEPTLHDDDDINEETVKSNGRTVTLHYLLEVGVYKAAFPIHDSRIEQDVQQLPVDRWPLRKYLYESWVRFGQWRRHQPLNIVRDYYGERVALYFAFLGFYIKMLIVPAVVGTLVFIYGLFSLLTDNASRLICSDSDIGNEVLCPESPFSGCLYTRLKQYCVAFRLSRVFESGSTFFSLFMAIWAVCFLEFWKRYQSKLCADWDVSSSEFTEDSVRPEYLLRVPHQKLNPVTMKMEPHLKQSSKFKRLAASLAAVVFFISVVVALLAAIMIYKAVGPLWWKISLDGKLCSEDDNKSQTDYRLVVSVTASLANGIFIAIMTKIYTKVAFLLTRAEFPRTESEFEQSYTYKVFIFQCVNFYGALFYLAFVRVIYDMPPHQQDPFDNKCPFVGCLLDVAIQLAVIFIGKQAINNVMEIGLPVVRALWRKFSNWKHMASNTRNWKSWQRDYLLHVNDVLPLFSDYLELIIQFGFVTMFVAAFPLAPLFALLNNIVELRLDAYKLVAMTQRCVPMRANNIQPWYGLLTVLTKAAVLTNVLLLAFTTNFVDRLVYEYATSHELSTTSALSLNSTSSFLYFSMSTFDLRDWKHSVYNELLTNVSSGVVDNGNGTESTVRYCRYVGYRNPPNDPEDPYGRSHLWWHVMASKLVFVLVFEYLVLFFQAVLAYLIPDVPHRVRLRGDREQHLQRANFMKAEMETRKTDDDDDDNNERSERETENGTFVEDELPEWAVPPERFGQSPMQQMQQQQQQRRRPIVQSPINAKFLKAAKLTGANNGKRKRPFILLLFRKLMLCE